jgi:hypothetical protein
VANAGSFDLGSVVFSSFFFGCESDHLPKQLAHKYLQYCFHTSESHLVLARFLHVFLAICALFKLFLTWNVCFLNKTSLS